MPVIRSAEEIVARIEEVKGGDLFGASVSDLLVHLPYEQAKPYLAENVTQQHFEEVAAEGGDAHTSAVNYLTFAIGKVVDHRGLSAGRSTNHFEAWLWLLFPDEEYAKFEEAGYTNYGAPKIKVAAEMLGADAVWAVAVEANPQLARMAEGEPCRPYCGEGCSA